MNIMFDELKCLLDIESYKVHIYKQEKDGFNSLTDCNKRTLSILK